MFASIKGCRTAWIVAGLGVLCAGLRTAMLFFALDEKALFITGHPLILLVWAVTILSVGFILWQCMGANLARRYADAFPPSVAAVIGQCLAAEGIFLTVLRNDPAMGGTLGLAWKLLGYLSFPALLAASFLRYRKLRPVFALRLVPCLFLIVHVVCHYQQWSSEPQVQLYVFSLLGAMSGMFFSFYRSAYDAGVLRPRTLMTFALLAAYFSLGALPSSGYPWLYLGIALWTLTGLPAKRARKRKPEEKQEGSP